MVAGEFGMLAERRSGVWRSDQAAHPPERSWRNFWGPSTTDLWLSGGPQALHRTASGWATVGRVFIDGDTTAVTGFDAGVFLASTRTLYRLDSLQNATWVSIASVGTSDDIQDLAVAFGELHGSIRRPDAQGGGVKNFSTDAGWLFDTDGLFRLFTSSTALFATGQRTVKLNASLAAVDLTDTLTTGLESNGQLYVATYGQVGVLEGRALTQEFRLTGVRSMAAGRTIFAVGSGGLVFERQSDGGWVDSTPTVTRAEVVAFVEVSGALVAITSDCELLVRGTAGWSRRALTETGCADAVSDGTSVAVLTSSKVVTLNARLEQTGVDPLMPGLEVRRLWRSDSGALVVTTATDVFLRLPGVNFEPVRGLSGTGAWGVSGRGSVARVCGFADGSFVDLDLSRNQPQPTMGTGPGAFDCRAVLPLRNGDWALASVATTDAGLSTQLHLLARDGGSRTFSLNVPIIEGLLETPTGIAAAGGRYAFVSFDGGTSAVEPRGRFSGVSKLGLWNGRLFVGGAGGSILQAPSP